MLVSQAVFQASVDEWAEANGFDKIVLDGRTVEAGGFTWLVGEEQPTAQHGAPERPFESWVLFDFNQQWLSLDVVDYANPDLQEQYEDDKTYGKLAAK